MDRFFLILILVATTGAFAAPSKKRAVSLFDVSAEQCRAIAGCDVRPADKVVVPSRTPKSVFEPARGCCSSHQGVCGCSGNRAVCCDGSFSPSCGCD